MPSGLAQTYFAIHASMLLYALGIALMLCSRHGAARWAWTVGCVLLWVHVALALHHVHRWDHADVVRTTAEQTARLTGVRAGAGVYLNYVFMLAWAVDAAYWWRAGHARYRRRPRAVAVALHGFLLFIAFNAAVVFAGPATRAASTATLVALAGLAVRRLARRGRDAPSDLAPRHP